MPTGYTLITSNTVGAGGTSAITFSSIPSTYTDLLIKCSLRTDLTAGSGGAAVEIKLNSTAFNSTKRLTGSGSAVASDGFEYFNVSASDYTANTFGNSEIYLPNYLSSNNKGLTVDSVGENNATATASSLNAFLFTVTSAITSISLSPLPTYKLVQYSTAFLYGIKNS